MRASAGTALANGTSTRQKKTACAYLWKKRNKLFTVCRIKSGKTNTKLPPQKIRLTPSLKKTDELQRLVQILGPSSRPNDQINLVVSFFQPPFDANSE